MLKQWDKGQQVILEANPDYYGEAPIMKKVTILFMEEDAAYAAVMSGQADQMCIRDSTKGYQTPNAAEMMYGSQTARDVYKRQTHISAGWFRHLFMGLTGRA